MESTVSAAVRPASRRERALTTMRALESRDFRFLWLNTFSFFIAGGMQMMTVGWLVKELTDSPSLVGLVVFAQGIPLALFSLPAGVWADRLDRRALLIVSQGASAALTTVLATLVIADVVSTPSIMVISLLMGTARALGQPSRQALVPALVGPERLMNAIVLTNLVQNLSFIIGPAVAGGLIKTVDFEGAFLAQVALLLVGFPWLLAMRAPATPPRSEAKASAVTELREGLAHIAESDFIRALFVVSAFTGLFFLGAYQALMPVFADDVLDVGADGLGFMNAMFGVGTFAGSIFIASRGDIARKGEILLWSLLIGSVVLAAFAVSEVYAVSLALLLAWGLGAAFFMNLTATLIQANTPDRLMGRVMSVQALAFFGLSPLGALLAGGIAEGFGAAAAALVGAAAVGGMSVWFLLRQPELRAAR